MFELIFFIIIAAYCMFWLFVLTGAKKRFPVFSASELPVVTVIVAARNEEQNILRCMESLNSQTYPADKLEILIVDDESTDATGSIIDAFITGKPAFKKITVNNTIPGLHGKTNALTIAIDAAKGDIIMTTDADCTVPREWVASKAAFFTGNTAMVTGYTAIEGNTGFSGMQAMDTLMLLTVSAGTINQGYPVSCIGNNLAFTKKAYNEVGGYRNLPFSVTEDFNLLMAIHKLNKYKIIAPLSAANMVTSQPCSSMGALYHQKKRWAVGGIKVPAYSYPLLATAWLAQAGLLLSPFFFTPAAGWLVFTKLLFDFMALRLVSGSLKQPFGFNYFLAFSVYYTLYVTALPLIVSAGRRVHWKGRTY